MSPHLVALLFLLAPQNVTINFPVTITNASIVAPGEVLQPLSTTTSDSPCAEVWAAMGPDGTDEPFELAADEELLIVGDVFRCTGVPIPPRRDGSQQ